MNKFLLSVHVLAAIIFVGPVTVAASMFPPLARRMLASDEVGDTGVLRLLHRISRGYAVGGLTVPVFGLAVGAGLGVLGHYWLIISMVLTFAAAVYWRCWCCLGKGRCWLRRTVRAKYGTECCRRRRRCR